MHIYFSGIGGSGVGPLALLAKQAGYTVSGSDKQDSRSIAYLKDHGITDIHIGQTRGKIAGVHQNMPIDWLVYSAAIEKENPSGHPELEFAKESGIKSTKENEFVNFVIQENNLKLIGVAGTHGKSTTTAMVIWLFKELSLPLCYSVGAKLSFAEPAHFDKESKYFVYECDEFDRKFLVFHPFISVITGVAWDHHEIYKTEEEYKEAFRQYIGQSEYNVVWQDNASTLRLDTDEKIAVLDKNEPNISRLELAGAVNREDAWQAAIAVSKATGEPAEKLLVIVNKFPGLSRRMEEIAPGLYSDYAHTPEKIAGALNTALEIAKEKSQKLVVIYEPLTNRRAEYIKDELKNVFDGASKLYWVPSYLARENATQAVLSPSELISHLDSGVQKVAEAAELDESLKNIIAGHLAAGDMVVAMSGGGGGSLDEWLRKELGK